MALIRTSPGIIEISGTMAGNTFAKDRYGHHVRTKLRKIRRTTPAQNNQRKAFMQARAFSKDNRVVSFNIYQSLNNLPMSQPPPDYTIPRL